MAHLVLNGRSVPHTLSIAVMFADVLNVYARDNVRAASPGIDGTNFQVFGLFDSMFPLIPSAGLSLEF